MTIPYETTPETPTIRIASLSELYRRVLTFFAVLMFVVGVVDALAANGVPHTATTFLFFAMASPLMLSRYGITAVTRQPLFLWIVFYGAITTIWFLLLGDSSSLIHLQLRIYALVYLVVMMLVVADPRVHRFARQLVLAGVVFGIGVSVYGTVSGAGVDRATALHDNPNAFAGTLLAGWIISMGILGHRGRHYLAMAVGAGVFLTFSRAGLLAWLVVFMMMLWRGNLRGREIFKASMTVSLLLIITLTVFQQWQSVLDQVRASLGEADALERLIVLQNLDLSRNPTTVERFEVATRAWGMFAAEPLVGHGLGTTRWSGMPSVHNMVLRDMAEFGLIGVITFPLFIMAVAWNARPEWRRAAAWFAAFLFIQGMTNHNVFESRALFLCTALFAALVQAPPPDHRRYPADLGPPMEQPPPTLAYR